MAADRAGTAAETALETAPSATARDRPIGAVSKATAVRSRPWTKGRPRGRPLAETADGCGDEAVVAEGTFSPPPLF